MAGERLRLAVALVHAPVLNRRGEAIASAVTNLDLHDIARVCRTYGVATYWVVTPDPSQQELVRDLAGHWLRGYGRRANPDRGEALALIRISGSLAETIRAVRREWGARTQVVATSARAGNRCTEYRIMRQDLATGRPVLLVLGTGWGLAPEALALTDTLLRPIDPGYGYNHLSVRSAVSIILDRLLGERLDKTTATDNQSTESSS